MSSISHTQHPAIHRPHDIHKNYQPGTLRFEAQLAFEAADGTRYALDDGMLSTPVATRGTWTLTVTNREREVPEGGLFSLLAINYQFAHRFQAARPQGRDYATLDTDSDATLRIAPFGAVAITHVAVESGVFAVGDSFTVRLGDRREGGPGSETFWSAVAGELRLAVDTTGDGAFEGIAANPMRLRTTARPQLDLLRVLGPTVARTGEPFDLHLVAFDCCRNVITGHRGEVTFDHPTLPDPVRFGADDAGVKIVPDIRLDEPGVHRLRGVTGEGAVVLSNPIVVRDEPDHRVLWGDIHTHGWGDNSMYMMHLRTDKLDPVGRHRQARDVGRFDWCAPGPMALPGDDRENVWRAWKDAKRTMDEPGRYVPFLSFEGHPPEGDRQVVFAAGDDEPCPDNCRMPARELLERYDDRDDALLEVHIGGSAPDWSKFQPAHEAMVEVTSGFGNAEWLLQDALRLGYRPAVVGATDAHLGLLGAPRALEPMRGRFAFRAGPMNQRDTAFGSGPIGAALAPDCERASIWRAFKQRQTYASSGARIYLHVTANDECVGSTIDARQGVRLRVECHGDGTLDAVTLICGEYALRQWRLGDTDFQIDETLAADELPGHWLYLRVRQADGEYAWSTPIWLDFDGVAEAGDLPRWDAPQFTAPDSTADEAAKHLDDVLNYLRRNEDSDRFHDVTPMRMLHESNGRAALFYCWCDDARYPMQIRWYPDFEMPRIRYDWGHHDCGSVHEFERARALGSPR